MFNLQGFIMKILKGMLEQEPTYKVMQYALNWYAKGVLTTEKLEEIEAWCEAVVSEDSKDTTEDSCNDAETEENAS